MERMKANEALSVLTKFVDWIETAYQPEIIDIVVNAADTHLSSNRSTIELTLKNPGRTLTQTLNNAVSVSVGVFRFRAVAMSPEIVGPECDVLLGVTVEVLAD